MKFVSLLCIWLGLSIGALAVQTASDEETTWTMLMVTPKNDIADCHLIKMPGGFTVLIDAGKLADTPDAVLNQLRANHVTSIDLMVISHFHIDHYGALTDLVEQGIQIKRVALNVPDKSAAERERPWGCDYSHVQYILEFLRSHKIPFFTPKAGERIAEVKTPRGVVASLDVICLFDGLNTPVGPTDVNDTSMIMRLTHGRTRALFTGDLNHSLGAYLAVSDFDLQAELLKVPHHGTEGLAPNEFFDRVGAKVALVPTPRKLWASPRSMRVRNYFIRQGIPVYVSGLRGNVTATLREDGYSMESEH